MSRVELSKEMQASLNSGVFKLTAALPVCATSRISGWAFLRQARLKRAPKSLVAAGLMLPSTLTACAEPMKMNCSVITPSLLRPMTSPGRMSTLILSGEESSMVVWSMTVGAPNATANVGSNAVVLKIAKTGLTPDSRPFGDKPIEVTREVDRKSSLRPRA
jgi:hypothetical protein